MKDADVHTTLAPPQTRQERTARLGKRPEVLESIAMPKQMICMRGDAAMTEIAIVTERLVARSPVSLRMKATDSDA
eukprot:Skav212800  [mRNA]  locus=scaffold1633:121403:121630:+ [translate_table: standard]